MNAPRRPRFLGPPPDGAVTPAPFSRPLERAPAELSQAATLARSFEARPAPQPLPVPEPPPAAAPAPSAPDTTQLAAAVERLRLEAARLAEVARADALEIGFAVARRILEQEIAAHPQALFTLVRQAVRRLGETRKLEVRLCPEDAARLEAAGPAAALSVAEVSVVADPALSPGDCVVESELGAVDGRLDERLEVLRRRAQSAAEDAA